MKISYNWLKEYVDFGLSAVELAEKLTDAGLVVADIKPVDDDFCLEVEVTSNRPDCLGIIGIAREVSAVIERDLCLPEIHDEVMYKETEGFTVFVEEPLLCPHYTATIIRNVKVKPSPEFIQKRLLCLGLRPVNNIVDITNYVMMETGQPLHAFDLDKISDRTVKVRRARDGEEIVTIQGALRPLFHDMLVIADSKKPVAIAGIMGNKETEVSASTTNILLECALFEPRQVRRTSKALGLASDSSYRFERGTDPEGVIFASQRAVKLMRSYADGMIFEKTIDIKSREYEKKMITLRPGRLTKVLGREITRDVTCNILKRLQFTVIHTLSGDINVEVPSFRGDVYREIDLIEEIARIYGYNNIPTKTSIPVRGSGKSKYEMAEDLIRQSLTGIGFFEVKTYSIVDASPFQLVNLWSDKEPVDIANPLRLEECRLRTCLLPNLITAKRYNINHGTDKVRIFEIARVYLAGEAAPLEKTCLSMLADTDFYSLKGTVELLLHQLGISSKCVWTPFCKPGLFREERAARILLDGRVLGYIGEASRDLGLKTEPCLLEIDVELLTEKSNFTKEYHALSQYPSVIRDLAVIVDERAAWASVEQCITGTHVPFLKEIQFFDIYRGKQIPAGKKSVAFSLCFQAHDRTLRGEEADAAVQAILDALRNKLGAELRTS